MSSKKCSRCAQVKALEEFNRCLTRSPDGRQPKCRVCDRAAVRAWKERNPKRARESFRAWQIAHADEIQARKRAQRRADSTQLRAWDSVYRAVQAGKLNRPNTCEQCEAFCKPHAHHDDYNRPLDVRWLCPRCHKRLHAALADQAAA